MGSMQNPVKRLSLSEEAISRFIDPRTNMRLRPLGVVGGRTVWPMLGASPDDPADKGDGKETEDKVDKPEDGDDSEDGKREDINGDPQAKITALTEEKDRQYRRRQEAEERARAVEQELSELKNKDKPEVERLKADLEKTSGDLKTAQEILKEERLKNAFLSDNTYNWHNPGRALQMADLSKVEIDDDGKVHGLKAALDALSKSDKYLLKTEEKSDKDEDDKPDTSNSSKNKSTKDKGKQPSKDDELRKKYPALRR